MTLVLFETAVGFCLFRLSDKGKVSSPDLHKQLETAETASNLLKLSAIHRFSSTAEAVEDAAALGEGKMSKGLKKFLTDEIVEGKKKGEQLVVVDPKLGGSISKKLGINVISDTSVTDLYRGIRTHLAALLSSSSSSEGALDPRDLNTMSLGLSHSLSRYKLKFSPDKVDTMIVQAIGLLDDLDKEVNIYAMRVKEWYGWHFPEMGKIITDNLAYAKCIRAMGFRTGAASTDFSEILPEEIEETLKAAAEISMGTEISESDLEHIWSLCDQVINITAYRAQLWSYLQNRMAAIAPNLTALVGELVGARLISHAGSLMNLAKHPASTVQILGAEKALFRALKTKHDTPKYGLIYHSSLVGQASSKLKGKMARMVATKAALSIRVDALADAETKGEEGAPTLGLEARAKLESRLRALEGRGEISAARGARGANAGYKQQAYTANAGAASRGYNTGADAVASSAPDTTMADTTIGDASNGGKEETKEERKARKEAKKAAKEAKKAAAAAGGADTTAASVTANGDDSAAAADKKEKKKKRKAEEAEGANGANGTEAEADKKKKKSKKDKA